MKSVAKNIGKGIGKSTRKKSGGQALPHPDRAASSLLTLQPDDHVMGNRGAPVTLIEYADFQCPYCAHAAEVVADLLATYGQDICYVFRHLPLTELHEQAELAARAAEAAAAQGKFWAMHNALFMNQESLSPATLPELVEEIGLDEARFELDLQSPKVTERVRRDLAAAEQLGLDSTPTFLINRRLYEGPVDLDALSAAIEDAIERRQGVA